MVDDIILKVCDRCWEYVLFWNFFLVINKKFRGVYIDGLLFFIYIVIFENKVILFFKISKVYKILNKGGYCDGVSGCDVVIFNICGIFVWE